MPHADADAASKTPHGAWQASTSPFSLRGLGKTYRDGPNPVLVFEGLDYDFPARGLVAISGPSGSGKTTLLNILGGLDRDYTGEMEIDGQPANSMGEHDWDRYRAQSLGFVFQEPHLVPYLDVAANVALGRTRARSGLAGWLSTGEALAAVGLAGLESRRPSELSGGQAQRVAIARALVKDPEVIIADEPTGSLDRAAGRAVMALLAELSEDRLVVVASHDGALIGEYAHRALVFDEGFHLIEDRAVRAVPGTSSPSASRTCPDAEPMRDSGAKPARGFSPWKLAARHLANSKMRTAFSVAIAIVGLTAMAFTLGLQHGTGAFMEEVAHDSLLGSPIVVRSEGFALIDTSADEAVPSEGHVTVSPTLQDAVSSAQRPAQSPLWNFTNYLDTVDDVIWENSLDVQKRYSVELNVYTESGKQVVAASHATFPDQQALEDEFGVRRADMIRSSLPHSESLMAEIVYNERTGAHPYEIVAGRMPEAADEAVIITDGTGGISDYFLSAIGARDDDERQLYRQLVQPDDENDPAYPDEASLESLLSLRYRVVPTVDYYVREDGKWVDHRDDDQYLQSLLADAQVLRIVGVVRPLAGASDSVPSAQIGYSSELVPTLAKATNKSEIVRDQKDNPNIDVFSGEPFPELATTSGASRREALRGQALALMDARFSDAKRNYVEQLNPEQLEALVDVLEGNIQNEGVAIDEDDIDSLAEMTYDEFVQTIEEQAPPTLNERYRQNLAWLGAAQLDTPNEICIFVDDLDSKDIVERELDAYNEHLEKGLDGFFAPLAYTSSSQHWIDQVQSVVDTVRVTFSALTLVALVLVAVMMAATTSIAALERREEIGLLRALGCSARGVVGAFCLENALIGIVSGAIAAAIALAVQPYANTLLASVAGHEGLIGIPAWTPAALMATGLVIGIAAAAYPALRAAHRNPAEVM